MKIPERVKVLYKNYQVKQVENLHNGANDLYGQIDYNSETISLRSDSSEEQKRATLVHEMVHALDEIFIIGLKEKQVEKLGNALYALIRDNPEIFGGDVS